MAILPFYELSVFIMKYSMMYKAVFSVVRFYSYGYIRWTIPFKFHKMKQM
jgi:hypothetical protein